MQSSAVAKIESDEKDQKDLYAVIVFNPAGTEILLESHEGKCRLPKIEIRKFRRPAKEITRILRDSWGLSSILLFSGMMQGRLVCD
jgi:hypothetical protein